jgi:hypothetical protein
MAVKDLQDLRPATRAWVKQILVEFQLESQHRRQLLIAARAWDRVLDARDALNVHGMTYEDKKGIIRPRPEIKIEHDGSIRFLRALRELDLDSEVLPEVRPPALRSNRALISLRGGNRAAQT